MCLKVSGIVSTANDAIENAQQGVENSVTESVEESTETDLDTINGELIIIQGIIEELKDAFDIVSSGGVVKVSSTDAGNWNKQLQEIL